MSNNGADQAVWNALLMFACNKIRVSYDDTYNKVHHLLNLLTFYIIFTNSEDPDQLASSETVLKLFY